MTTVTPSTVSGIGRVGSPLNIGGIQLLSIVGLLRMQSDVLMLRERIKKLEDNS